MKSVWLVTVGEPLIGPLEKRAPLRAGRLAISLRDAGWEVTWWTSGFDHFRKVRFTEDERRAAESTGIRIEWLDGRTYADNVSLAREWNHVQLAVQFRRRARSRATPSVIVASIPPIELTAAVASYVQRSRVPLLIDVRDLWPDVFEWGAPPSLRPLVHYAVLPLRALTRRAFRRARAVVGVSEGYLRWGLAHANRERGSFDGVIPIFGPPRHTTGAVSAFSGVAGERIVVAFVGSFGRSYDLETVVQAARRLPKDVADRIQIVIGGDGDERATLEAGARDLGHLKFTGWLDARGVAELFSVARVGLAAYSAGALQSLPNKIIDYLSYGLPILGSLSGECEALLRRSGAGWTYQAGNPDALATVLTAIIRAPNRIATAAERARALFGAEFEPENSMRQYCQLLDSLATAQR